MDISIVLRDIVGILLMSPMPVITVVSACACFHRQWKKKKKKKKTFWYKLYQIENFGLKLVGDGNLEILLDNADDASTNKLIKCVVTQL